MDYGIHKADIHDFIKGIPDNSISLIYTDPPFATTKCKWDKELNWKELFPEMWRVLKSDGIIILYSAIPFTYKLLQYDTPRYHYSWIKNNSTGFFHAKKQPLRVTEEIFVYYKKPGTYNPQMVGDKFNKKRMVKIGNEKQPYWGTRNNIDKSHTCNNGEGHVGNYPLNVLNYPVRKDRTGITRTDEHIDYFIKTYSNEEDIVLDMTCHNNYVSERCKKHKRNYIGVDIDPQLS
jgi:DNA modification methylase